MNYDHIRDQFITEAENLINDRKQSLFKGAGVSKLKAMADHLETFEKFSEELNVMINDVLKRNDVEFSSEEEKDDFTSYIKPTFETLFKKYISF